MRASAVRWWKRRRTALRSDQGGLELFYAGVILIGFLIIGMVIDLGLALNSRSDAFYIAQSAARTGAQRVDPGEAITGEAIVIDPDAATAAAEDYLSAEGAQGAVTTSGDGQNLNVTAETTFHPYVLSLFGVSSWSFTGHGSATLLHAPGG
ncbi:TadE/TadG family type IV pilus assembly protein [Streptomyces sp. BH097]|uniref:TadE/TadG family type IV pilus assembly protein n=1 Tax=unclassified Streptomyces TaxID=2593676 RepID=UPI003BB816A5